MPITRGLGTTGDAAGTVTPLDHKLAQAGLLAKVGAGSNLVRPGLFFDGVTNIVTGTSGMSYNVAAFTAALTRGAAAGVVLLANDGTVNVPTTAAPGSNSRIDVVYVWQREFSLDGVDSNPVIGVVQGTPAAVPTVPSLAAFPGAMELARITVPAGVTATNSGTTITQKAPFTCMAGGVLPFRSTTERNAATVAEGQLGWLLDADLLQRFDGSTWGSLMVSPRIIPSAATNGSVSAQGVVTSTAQSFVRVRDAFPAGFTVFRCIFDIVASGATGPTFVLAAGATDAASGYDNERQQTIASATTAPAQTLNIASAELSAIGVAGARHVGEVLITSPNVATQTFWDSSSVVSLAAGMTTSLGKVTSGGMHRTATAYDSIRLQVAVGTLTINRFVVEGVV